MDILARRWGRAVLRGRRGVALPWFLSGSADCSTSLRVFGELDNELLSCRKGCGRVRVGVEKGTADRKLDEQLIGDLAWLALMSAETGYPIRTWK